MKKRLISVAVGLVLLAIVMWLYDTLLLNLVLVAIATIAVYELTKALGFEDLPALTVPSAAISAIYLVFMPADLMLVYSLLLLSFAVIMSVKRRHYTYRQSAAFVLAVLMVTLGLGSILRARELSECTADGRFMLGFGLGLGWICDTFAFTFGKLFGKRKLCPSISPNKTVAGAVGGVVGTPVVAAAAYWIYSSLAEESALYGTAGAGSLLFFLLVGAAGAVIGIYGDLAASYIKRECGIKDFGNIMPGHGGALDRIDSVLFTSVFSYFCFYFFIEYFV